MQILNMKGMMMEFKRYDRKIEKNDSKPTDKIYKQYKRKIN